MTQQRPVAHIQTVRNAWTNALRAEVLRVGSIDLARVGRVGVWLATYADADGGNAFPSRETLAALAGCTEETVTRALKVLVAVGMLTKKRRPNSTAVYQLLMPTERPDWDRHLHLYTETRQRKARAAKKLQAIEEREQSRTASPDALRTASPPGVPDSVPTGGSGQRPRTPSEGSDSVPGRPRTASPNAVRTASPAGGYQYLPTSGRDPENHQTAPGLSPQPPVRAGTQGENDHLAATQPLEPIRPLCTACGDPMLPRPGRTTHAHCTPADQTAGATP